MTGTAIQGPSTNELRKLERAGLLESVLDLPDIGPARRVYRITQLGASVLDESASEIAHLIRLLRRFSYRYRSMHTYNSLSES